MQVYIAAANLLVMFRSHEMQCLRVDHHMSLKEEVVDGSISVHKASHMLRKMQD